MITIVLTNFLFAIAQVSGYNLKLSGRIVILRFADRPEI